MRQILCTKCKEELLLADDSGNDSIVRFSAECPCGTVSTEVFLGYPKLAGNDKYYFEFVDEFKVVCRPRRKK